MKSTPKQQYGDVELGRRLRRLRLSKGLTQADLAKPSYTHAHVSTIEAGRRMPSADALEFFAQKLGIDSEELATGRSPAAAPALRRDLETLRLEISKGAYANVRPKIQSIKRQAKQFGLVRVEARAFEIEALAWEQDGKAEEALRRYEKAADILREDAPTARAYAVAGQVRCLKALNDPHQAVFIGENYLERLKRLHMTAPGAVLRVQSAMVLAYFAAGARTKAQQVADECQSLIRKVHDPSNLAAAYVNVGAIQLDQGFHDDANVSFAKAEELFEVLELQNESAVALLARGYNYSRSGDLKNARSTLEKASPLLLAARNVAEHANAEMELARIDRLEGDHPQAIERLESVLSSLSEKDQPRLVAWAHRELGLALAPHDQVRSSEHLNAALRLYEDEHLHLETARTHVMAARLLPKTSKKRLEKLELAASAVERLSDL